MPHTLKLIIVGRDGILNEFHEDHIKAPEEWVAVPGALHALIHRLKGRNQTAIVPDHDGVGTQADT